MKKVLFVVAVIATIGFVSCKKDYTCRCTSSGNPDIDLKLEDVKKKDAKDACQSAGNVYIIAGYTCAIV